jgi:predicted ATP-dependent endonuclease of OLD family
VSESVHITALALENVKRVKAFTLNPEAAGLTIIGGNNGNGKTSVLDAIAWLLGGKKYEPTNAQRDGAISPPELRIELSNGLVVERKGKNSELKVMDPSGKKAGQALLDAVISPFALDLPKFMNSNDKEKAQVLLKILGVGDQLAALEQEETTLYNRRHAIGQEADRKRKYADELPEYPDAPDAPLSISELIKEQQAILARNGENERLRIDKLKLERDFGIVNDEIMKLKAQLAEKEALATKLSADLETAAKSVAEIQDASTAEIEASIANMEAINAQVAANLTKAQADADANEYRSQYDALTSQLTDVREKRLALLNSANLPLPGLGVQDGLLTYNGKAWDCMSGSEQLRVAVAIVRKLNPECGFVLMDKLEQFDMRTLTEFTAWLQAEGLQAIATRVSTGEECSIIIEDGLPAGKTYLETARPLAPAVPVADDDDF